MLAASSSPAAHHPAPMSDGNSSSLSELDDLPDEQPDFEEASDEEDAQSAEDNDTEAETERIDPSPAKVRRDANESTAKEENDNDEGEGGDTKEILSPAMEPFSPLAAPVEAVLTSADEPTAAQSGVADADAPRKRKRSSSLSDIDDASDSAKQPARKRSSSRHLGRSMSPVLNADTKPNETTALSDLSEEEVAAPEEAPAPLRKSKRRRGEEDPTSGPAASPGAVGEEEGADNEEGEEGEAAAAGDDQDEVDPTARSEEEQARKMVAMDNFKAIESKWAIFRDKLFDERLQALTDAQEDLEKDEPSNTTYLRQRQCLDERRDEKIRIEDRLLEYKEAALDRTSVANRTVCMSQFWQDIRAIRERALDILSEDLNAISHERKQSRTRDAQYGFNFNADRQKQLYDQTSYNKEISVLSGIAKYNGFPGAPDLAGASASEIAADLAEMNVRPQRATATPSGHGLINPPQTKAKGTLYSQIANSKHNDEMAGEEQFLAKNTWARNPPPPPRMLQERPMGPAGVTDMGPSQRNGHDMPADPEDAVPDERRTNGISTEKTFAKNPLGIFQPSGEGSSSPSGAKAQRRDGHSDAKAGRDETKAPPGFPISHTAARDGPQFGPLPSGITTNSRAGSG